MGIKTKKVSYNAQRQTPCYYCYCFSATDRPVLKGQKSSLQTAIHQTQSDGSSDGSSSTSNEGTEIISPGAQKKKGWSYYINLCAEMMLGKPYIAKNGNVACYDLPGGPKRPFLVGIGKKLMALKSFPQVKLKPWSFYISLCAQ